MSSTFYDNDDVYGNVTSTAQPSCVSGSSYLSDKEIEMINRMTSVTHALSRRNRAKLCCLRMWSCERLVHFVIIILCFSILLASGLMISFFVEGQWKSSLQHGSCTSLKCETTYSKRILPPNNAQCYCNMMFVASENNNTLDEKLSYTFASIVPSSIIAQPSIFPMNVVFFNETFPGGACNNRFNLSYTCWMSEIKEVWTRVPNLWLLRLIGSLVVMVLCASFSCFMFAFTYDSDVIDNVPNNIARAIKAEQALFKNGNKNDLAF